MMEQRPSIIPVLPFDEVWLQCLSKPFEFAKVMQHSAIQKLEGLRLLSAMRSSALESRPLNNEVEKSTEKSVSLTIERC